MEYLIRKYLGELREQLQGVYAERDNELRKARIEGLMIALENVINMVLGPAK
jgi:hypothetical protein